MEKTKKCVIENGSYPRVVMQKFNVALQKNAERKFPNHKNRAAYIAGGWSGIVKIAATQGKDIIDVLVEKTEELEKRLEKRG